MESELEFYQNESVFMQLWKLTISRMYEFGQFLVGDGIVNSMDLEIEYLVKIY